METDVESWIAGYSAPGLEKVSRHIYDHSELAENRAKAPDMKESFESGREQDEAMPNIWLPEGILPGFREACLDFFWVRGRSVYGQNVHFLRAPPVLITRHRNASNSRRTS
jgi:hypothetical protein